MPKASRCTAKRWHRSDKWRWAAPHKVYRLRAQIHNDRAVFRIGEHAIGIQVPPEPRGQVLAEFAAPPGQRRWHAVRFEQLEEPRERRGKEVAFVRRVIEKVFRRLAARSTGRG